MFIVPKNNSTFACLYNFITNAFFLLLRMKHKKLGVITLLIAFIILISLGSQSRMDTEKHFHTTAELEYFQTNKIMAPIGPGEYFHVSSSCRGCHGTDSAGVANIDEDGNDVNLFDHWQSTMMANSARDPLWRAKVSHEILVNPPHANHLQDKCTSCHAPMGRYTAFFHGATTYGLADIANDSLGADGVSCASCHTIDSTVGLTFSGTIPYDTTRNIYGPFTMPLAGPMQLYEGYTPQYSPHMNEARLCSSCHTLITQTVDTSGNFTGGEFVEQATYHEYLNSGFPANSVTCQTCHMPQLNDAIIIANGFASINPRYPFNQHEFVGANSFMLKMIKDNKVQLGATADDWKFDSTIAATNRLLTERTINLNLQLDSIVNDSCFFNVRIENKAGHKFPSGYPSRRAVVQLVAIDAVGDTVFKSGTFTNDFRVAGETPAFEPHHNSITQPDVPQIYELVMGDVNFNFTSVLERAAHLLKDNRIPPLGFTTMHNAYDTTKISSDALADDDFNKINTVQGSGVDRVHYTISLAAATGSVNFYARVFYQAVPPKWVDEMFTFSSAEIDSFQNMFNAADQTPFLVASDSILNITLGTSAYNTVKGDITLTPTATTDGKVVIKSINGGTINRVEVYASNGKKVSELNTGISATSLSMVLPKAAGVYYFKITARGVKNYYKKVLKL